MQPTEPPVVVADGLGVHTHRGWVFEGLTFKAAAGQKLYWTETGAVARLVITYPNGDSDGPGFDNPLTLPATGTYQIAVSPNLMAEGAFGRFKLTLKIPPLR